MSRARRLAQQRNDALLPLGDQIGEAGDDAVEDDNEVEMTTPIRRNRRDDNNMATTTTTSTTSTVTPVMPLAFTYDDFWRSMRRIRVFIAGIAFGVTIFSAVIFLLWLFRVIPSLPTSLLSYGFIWYIVIFFTAILDFFISCSRNRELYLITLVINIAALGVALFMACVILYQVVLCIQGQSDTPNCESLFFTRALLFFLTLAITLLLGALIFLFSLVLVRFSQVYLRLLSQQRRARQLATN